jgi:hypothetical protein
VTCLSFGRYWREYIVQTPRNGLKFDPWRPNSFDERDFLAEHRNGQVDQRAQPEAERLMQLRVPHLLRPTSIA